MLDDILKGLNKVKQNAPEFEGLITKLKDLKATYTGLASVKAADPETMYDVALKADEVKILANKIIALRNEITKI
jgi:hypothetical protein